MDDPNLPDIRPDIRPPLRTAVDIEQHANRGGKAYSKEMRELVLFYYYNDPDELTSAATQIAQAAGRFPSNSTICRWVEREQTLGHVCPFRRTGNHRARRELRGQALIDLAFYRLIFPKAQIAEVKAFIFNRNPTVAPYSDSQIHRAEDLLQLTRKAASTTSDKAWSEENLVRRHNYWNCDYPMGIADSETRNMIDIDELGIFLELTNRKFGKAVRAKHCDNEGIYNRGQQQNTLAGICGDPDTAQ